MQVVFTEPLRQPTVVARGLLWLQTFSYCRVSKCSVATQQFLSISAHHCLHRKETQSPLPLHSNIYSIVHSTEE